MRQLPMTDRLPHLDTLRAAAILLVLLHHFHVPGFAQGYLGVDLFLLLSGFLMTWTMLRDRERHGHFRILAFYIRRFRRIVPSLWLSIIGSIFLGYLILSPSDLYRLIKESLYAVGFVSNIYFYTKGGYFDPSANNITLLHTWSLSLEEQFYILFGALLLISNRGMSLGRTLLFAFICATIFPILYLWIRLFGYNYSFIDGWDFDRAAFFLLPFRLYLFLGGAIAGWWAWKVMRHHSASSWPGRTNHEALRLLLAVGVFLLVSMTDPLPALASMAVFLAWLPLLFGGKVLTTLGSQQPWVQFLAKISYQVYLVHWPLLVFFRYLFYRDPEGLEALFLLAMSIWLGWGLWRMADWLTAALHPSRLTTWMATGMLPIILGAAFADRGGHWRIPEERLFASSREFRNMQDAHCQRSNPEEMIRCERLQKLGMVPDFFLVGDSFTDHLVPGLVRLLPDLSFRAIGTNACPPQLGISGHKILELEARFTACLKANKELYARLIKLPPTKILLTFRLPPGLDDEKARQVDQILLQEARVLTRWLEGLGHHVLWLAPLPVPGIYVPSCLSAPAWKPNTFLQKRCRFLEKVARRSFEFEKQLVHAMPGRVAASAHIICPGHEELGTQACKLRDEHGQPLFRDESHLTPLGSVYFVNHLLPKLRRFLEGRAAKTPKGTLLETP